VEAAEYCPVTSPKTKLARARIRYRNYCGVSAYGRLPSKLTSGWKGPRNGPFNNWRVISRPGAPGALKNSVSRAFDFFAFCSQRRFFRGPVSREQGTAQRNVRGENHRQEGAERQRGLLGQRDQGVAKVMFDARSPGGDDFAYPKPDGFYRGTAFTGLTKRTFDLRTDLERFSVYACFTRRKSVDRETNGKRFNARINA